MTLRSNYTTRVFRFDKNSVISTLCPHKNYFFKIKEPNEIAMGLFVCQISFFDINHNLIYHKFNQYVTIDFYPDDSASIVKWSKSGQFAYFVEYEVANESHVVVDLNNKRVSETKVHDNFKDDWTSELYKQLPQDKAQEVYYKIISTPQDKIDDIFAYVLNLKLIDDKRELIKALTNYFYNEITQTFRQLKNDNFDDSLVLKNWFEFESYKCDKLKSNLLDYVGIFTWRPR